MLQAIAERSPELPTPRCVMKSTGRPRSTWLTVVTRWSRGSTRGLLARRSARSRCSDEVNAARHTATPSTQESTLSSADSRHVLKRHAARGTFERGPLTVQKPRAAVGAIPHLTERTLGVERSSHPDQPWSPCRLANEASPWPDDLRQGRTTPPRLEKPAGHREHILSTNARDLPTIAVIHVRHIH
jgi:hypothetical protein